MDSPVRVRFAPSPTGPLHIGGLRTALYNYLFAKKNNGTFVLRIEDTDNSRYVEGATEYILEALKWCNIHIDEGFSVGGPHEQYQQSQRKHIYKDYAIKLVENGYAYYAFDTPNELASMRVVKSDSYNYITRMRMNNSLTLPAQDVQNLLKQGCPYVIRIKINRNESLQINDLVRGDIVINTSELDDKVLFKSDGMPTYHLANVIDDYLMDITHVIRGEEWLPSMPLHVLLYKYLQIEDKMPKFAHLPLLLNPSGKGKLSKRDGDKLNIPVFPLKWQPKNSNELYQGYRENGYLPEAIINMLALLGWNPGTNQELFTMQELINTFSIDKISKSGAKFNIEKAKWFNHQHIIRKPPEYFLNTLKQYFKKNNIACNNDDYLLKVLSLVKEKLNLTTQLWEHSYYFFKTPEIFDTSLIKDFNEEHKTFLKVFLKKFTNYNGSLHADIWENIFNETAIQLNIKPKNMLKTFRISISGLSAGPPIFAMAELMGKEKISEHITAFLEASM